MGLPRVWTAGLVLGHTGPSLQSLTTSFHWDPELITSETLAPITLASAEPPVHILFLAQVALPPGSRRPHWTLPPQCAPVSKGDNSPHTLQKSVSYSSHVMRPTRVYHTGHVTDIFISGPFLTLKWLLFQWYRQESKGSEKVVGLSGPSSSR